MRWALALDFPIQILGLDCMTSSPLAERSRAHDSPALPREPFAPDISGPSRAGLIPLLAVLYAAGLALFITLNPPEPWILFALTVLVGLGTDGIMRGHPRGQFSSVADTAPHLFVPVLFSLSAGLFLEDVVLGYWAAPAVVGAGVLMGCAVYAEHISVEPESTSFPAARFVLNLVTYLAAFGFYSVVYGFDVELLPAAASLALVSMLLSVEVFRDAEADPIRALVFAAVIGVIIGEARWVLYFIPLDGFLAAVFLLLAFYLTTGVISHYLTDHLNAVVLLEFAAVTAIGLSIVIGGTMLS
jgi:hypothetical protein